MDEPRRPLDPGCGGCAVIGGLLLILLLVSPSAAFYAFNLRAQFGVGERVTRVLSGNNASAPAASTSPCPKDSLQEFRRNTRLWQAMNQNMATYKAAAAENGVPWEMIAALHYREHTFGRSDPNGEGPFQLTTYYNQIQSGNPPTYKGKPVTMAEIRDFGTSARLAADILKQKTGGGLSASPSDATVKDAFWGYNGRAYGSADRSPYVMNNFDDQHKRMRISGFVRGVGQISATDTKDGAFTVYYLLRYLGVYDAQGHLTGFKDCESSRPSGGEQRTAF